VHGSSLERLGCCIQADQDGNHDSRGDTQILVREVDQLDWLLAPQLLDLERVTVDAANKDARALIDADGVNSSRRMPRGAHSRFDSICGSLELLEARIDLERLPELLGTQWRFRH
jgi:hypothetical protein